jgi:integration host factor subunit beta
MTKKDIARLLAERHQITAGQALAVVQGVLDGIIDALVTQGRIELRNFGIFEVKKRQAREFRNPRTGAPVSVPERLIVSFKAGREMQERVEKLKKAPRR